MQKRIKKMPPSAAESPPVLHELIKSRGALTVLRSSYAYGYILLHSILPSVAQMLDAMGREAEKGALALGLLLRAQGASHAVSVMLRDTPYPLPQKAEDHAPAVALQLIKDRIRDEKNGVLHGKALQKRAATEAVRQALAQEIRAAEERLAHLEEAARALSVS